MEQEAISVSAASENTVRKVLMYTEWKNKYTTPRLRCQERNQEREMMKGGKQTVSVMKREFQRSTRFQWENEFKFKHFIIGKYLLKCKHHLGISSKIVGAFCVCVVVCPVGPARGNRLILSSS